MQKLSFSLFFLFTLVLFLRPQELFLGMGAIHFAYIFGLSALLSYFIQNPLGLAPLLKERESKILIALLALIILTIPFGLWPGGSFKTLSESFMPVFVSYFLIVGIVNSTEKIIKIAWVITICIAINSILGLIDYMRGESLVFGRLMGRASGLYGNPNDLAITLCLALPFILFLIRVTRASTKKLFLYGTAGITLVTIVFTYSRAGILAMAIIFFGLLVKSKKKLRTILIVALLLSIIISLGSQRFLERTESIFDSSKDEVGSRQQRIQIFETGIKAFRERPIIGVGLGNFVIVEGESHGGFGQWKSAHNGYVEIAVELGVFGLLIFLSLLYFTLMNLRKIQKHFSIKKDLSNEFYLCQFLEIDLWTYLITLIFGSSPYEWIFFYLLGFSVSVRKSLSTKLDLHPRPDKNSWTKKS